MVKLTCLGIESSDELPQFANRLAVLDDALCFKEKDRRVLVHRVADEKSSLARVPYGNFVGRMAGYVVHRQAEIVSSIVNHLLAVAAPICDCVFWCFNIEFVTERRAW